MLDGANMSDEDVKHIKSCLKKHYFVRIVLTVLLTIFVLPAAFQCLVTYGKDSIYLFGLSAAFVFSGYCLYRSYSVKSKLLAERKLKYCTAIVIGRGYSKYSGWYIKTTTGDKRCNCKALSGYFSYAKNDTVQIVEFDRSALPLMDSIMSPHDMFVVKMI